MRSGGDLDPIVPGRRVTALFGFCDIRHFTDVTEVLQEGVMEFVNTIAHVVHREARGAGGVGGRQEAGRARGDAATTLPSPLPLPLPAYHPPPPPPPTPPNPDPRALRSLCTAAPRIKTLGTLSSWSGSFLTAWTTPRSRPRSRRRPAQAAAVAAGRGRTWRRRGRSWTPSSLCRRLE